MEKIIEDDVNLQPKLVRREADRLDELARWAGRLAESGSGRLERGKGNPQFFIEFCKMEHDYLVSANSKRIAAHLMWSN